METQTGSRIFSIHSREILDSRATPTVETTVILESGYKGTVSVPSGASVGKYEAVELRDKDENRFSGLGVLKAVQNINTVIASQLHGKDILKQSDIDKIMIDLDGTPNKIKLGANAILSVSLSVCYTASQFLRIPLYRYINQMINTVYPITIKRIPTPLFNMINGGKHGAGNLNFQEFLVIPRSDTTFRQSLIVGVETYMAIKQILEYRNAIHSLGDEGGFAPNLFTNEDALEIINEAVRSNNHQIGLDIFLGMDVAASHFNTEKGYLIKDRPAAYSTKEFIGYFKNIYAKYRLLLLEDPIDEDDWGGWQEITKEMGKEILIVGDDLIVSNYKRLEQAIRDKACSAVILKPNQIGTLSELLATVVLAKKNDIKCIVSHRSGETNDTFIADLAVGIQSEYVKFGAPARGERVAKYNRLSQIEDEILPV
jgi:enolase